MLWRCLTYQQFCCILSFILAVKEVDLKANKTKVPYITEDGGASTDYTNYHYFFNEEAHGLIREKWLGENLINVLSHIYFDSLADDEKDNITAIFANLGFNEFTKDSFITTVKLAMPISEQK